MSKQVNVIKKAKVKYALLQSKSAKEAMLESGFAPATAHNATKKKVVKDCQREILGELKQENVTVALIIKRIDEDRNLAKARKDTSTMLSADIALGKYLAMFTDKQEVSGTIEHTQQELNEYNRLRADIEVIPTGGIG